MVRIFKNIATDFELVLTFAVSVLVVGAIIAGITTKFFPAKTLNEATPEPSPQIPCCTIQNKKAYQSCVEELKPLDDYCRAFLNGSCEKPLICENACFPTYGSDLLTCPCKVTFS